MGICPIGKGAADPRLDLDKTLGKQALKKHKEDAKVRKILLLGSGSAGKSTIFKQIIHLYGPGFKDQDRSSYHATIYHNVLYSIQALLRPVYSQFEDDSDLKAFAEEVMELNPGDAIDEHQADAIHALWVSDIIQAAFRRRTDPRIPESVSYFFNKIKELTTPGYLPTIDDILRVRAATTAITQTPFTHKEGKYLVVDVGGQKNERRKWIHCFEDVSAVIFVCAANEYDEVLIEDEKTNRLHDSLELFETICRENVLRCDRMVFLNKKDLLEEKLKIVPLNVCFPDYKGDNSYNSAKEFLKSKFRAIASGTRREVHVYDTCATSSENISKILAVVLQSMIKNTLEENGLEL